MDFFLLVTFSLVVERYRAKFRKINNFKISKFFRFSRNLRIDIFEFQGIIVYNVL